MDDDRKLVMVLGYYFSIGTLLSLTLHLWSEEIKSKIKGVIDVYKRQEEYTERVKNFVGKYIY